MMVTDLRFGNVVVERRRKQILNIVGFVVSVEYVGLILSKLVLIMDRSRSLEHILHTPTGHLPCYTLFSEAASGWETIRSGPSMTW